MSLKDASSGEVGYDLIGDVHGQAEKMDLLLSKMGYTPRGRGYKAPANRKAIFLGDLIDRGPGQLRVLEAVRDMVEEGDALCILGNHEFNAISYVAEDPEDPGECLRPNRRDSAKSTKNREQHIAFLEQVGEGSAVHLEWVQWFKTLPVYLDLGGLRAVHGCWDDGAVASMQKAGWSTRGPRSDEQILQAHKDEEITQARKLLTCGLEIDLPPGQHIVDKAGHRHSSLRIANWRDWASELHQVALVPPGQGAVLRDMEWPADLVISTIEGSPVFVGHHWFSGHPVIESPKLACLDWSAARNGPLVSYRWSGESELTNANLVWAGGSEPLIPARA